MRIGHNPNKDKKNSKLDYFHQVIIPVYIPNEEGYFKDSFQIFKYCLESLFKTCHKKTYFTVVNNGSCDIVVGYLANLYNKKIIHELIHTTNIGKLNAILKGIVGHSFSLITIADADVLFLNNWQKETYKIFEGFSKAGIVSTTPNPKLLRYLTSNTIFDLGFSKRVKFTKVKNKKALKLFAESIGDSNLFKPVHLKQYLTVTNGKEKAVIGAGHFVGTYRGEIFDRIKQKASTYSLGGGSEITLLDKPVIDYGYWRLSTEDNYTYHMGNTHEEWMDKALNSLEEELNIFEIPTIKKGRDKKIVLMVYKIFSRIIFKQFIWRFFLRLKGLDKKSSIKY
ncbi:glycosyltransferase family A protein [Lutibacter sp. TH_r2]|uniref:glycosyltransferase family A protein n=1 Tax=Lutibacter sp. TH_r2 TaxID=3082083 RepID=UPI0029537F96|nr:glycosyltransferase family A protein [Lutibacter sp. TH_r2]MDV7187447.1 glycosyltransferase family A protein [Lutibacter sp. TH_r2]